MNDHFATLGISHKFRDEDAAQLERRFHELQRRYHPDRSATKGEVAVAESLEHSSLINQAYRILREPMSRAKYLLSIYGYSVERSKQVPMDLLELVMNVQEFVEQMESGAKLDGELLSIEQDLSARIASHKAEIDLLRNEWDNIAEHSAPGSEQSADEQRILEALTRSLATRSYLQTLYETLAAAKEGKTLILKH